MTQEQIKGNKLILKFIGGRGISCGHSTDFGDNIPEWYVNKLKYHSSLDWLIPVVEKICKMGYDLFIGIEWNDGEMSIFTSFSNTEGTLGGLYKRTSDKLIDLIFFRVVEAIKHINQTKQL
jgi:hypothetical protein